jgi:hypothetical protein
MPDAPLIHRDRLAIGLLVLVAVAAGVLTEMRSAFAQRRHTDAGVYFRAAWAVRAGENPYTLADDNGWHFTYPVLVAIVFSPFADAPAGVPQPALALPYPVSVAVWYALSFALLVWSSHHLCRALEDAHPDGPRRTPLGGRRFWWVRCWPIWICLPAIGSTIVRGQMNLLVLALLSGCIAAVIRGQRARAGWWLAAATCVKVIPGLLVLYPLFKRDWRMLGHFALGAVVGVVVIPVVALGPEQARETTETFVNQTILPGLTTNHGALSNELTDMTATDNQSVRAIIHAAANWGQKLPPEASASTKLMHAVVSVLMIAATFLAARRCADPRYRTLFLLGALVIVCVAVTPVNHTHYMALALPAVLGLVYWELEHRGTFSFGPLLIGVVFLHVASGIYPRVPALPGYQAARDLGVTMLGTLVVWLAALWRMAGSPGRIKSAPAENSGGLRLPGVSVLK